MRSIFQYKQKYSLYDLIDRALIKRTWKIYQKHQSQRTKPMAIYAHDWIGLHIEILGTYDKKELDLLSLFLKPIHPQLSHTVMLDIGANIGNHALYFSKFFKRVIAYEPNPNTFSLLNINANLASNISCFNYGLGDQDTTLPMHEVPDNMGASRINSDKPSELMISIKKLDTSLNTDIPVGLMKIDVEGFEYLVLKGAEKTIQKNRPIVIFEQLKDEFTNQATTPSIQFLKSLNYELYFFDNGFHAGKSFIFNKANTIKRYLLGETYSLIKFEDNSPPADYYMLIAIPKEHSILPYYNQNL